MVLVAKKIITVFSEAKLRMQLLFEEKIILSAVRNFMWLKPNTFFDFLFPSRERDGNVLAAFVFHVISFSQNVFVA